MFYFESVIATAVILCLFSVIQQLCNLRKELSILNNIHEVLAKTQIYLSYMELKYLTKKPEVIKEDKPIPKGRGIARPFEPGEIKKVYSMIDKGVSPKEIAKRLNRSLSSIFLYNRKWTSRNSNL